MTGIREYAIVLAVMKTITCSDCGAERKTKYANVKYCLVCRTARNMKFLKETRATCVLCDEKFAPLKRGDEVCGKCDDITSAGDPVGNCGLCGDEEVPILYRDIAVCRPCSTDPGKRKDFRQRVLRKRKIQMDANAKAESE